MLEHGLNHSAFQSTSPSVLCTLNLTAVQLNYLNQRLNAEQNNGLTHLTEKTKIMDINQQSSADHIIEHLNAIDVDGETMQYIIEKTGMRMQMLYQLTMSATESEINVVLAERNEFYNQPTNH